MSNKGFTRLKRVSSPAAELCPEIRLARRRTETDPKTDPGKELSAFSHQRSAPGGWLSHFQLRTSHSAFRRLPPSSQQRMTAVLELPGPRKRTLKPGTHRITTNS